MAPSCEPLEYTEKGWVTPDKEGQGTAQTTGNPIKKHLTAIQSLIDFSSSL